MAKRSKIKKAIHKGGSRPAVSVQAPRRESIFPMPFSSVWLALALAMVAFFVYWPSLKSDFVYDARIEILQEGFVTSLSNLPSILSLKVLGTNLMLGDRPGQLLYLMLNAALWGKEPFGYHICSNLLHAANVALLYVLLLRLAAVEMTGWAGKNRRKVQLAAAAVTLIFAVHPLATETVSEVNYSSDLLVTFFTLLALLAATVFDSKNFRLAVATGCAGTLCAFAAVTCKESGMAAALLLIVYWFLFRRGEAKGPWFLFLGAATLVTAAFLAARFLFAPPSLEQLSYLGGSFSQVFLIQPRFWIFMMGKLIWPVQLSADYTIENVNGLSTPLALAILVIVVSLQGWLATKSRLGALGVAIYWLGLATVSNFLPLYRILADRFYYLPMTGVAMQLLAVVLLVSQSRARFWVVTVLLLVAVLPLLLLTVIRQDVFADEFALWTDTVQASPFSSLAHCDLGAALLQKGQVDEAIAQCRQALEIDPNLAEGHNDLGNALLQKGQVDDAITQFQAALEINPKFAGAQYNLANTLLQKGRVDDAIAQYRRVLEIDPDFAGAHYNLANTLLQKGLVEDAIVQYQKALEINPNYVEAHTNLGVALVQKGQVEDGIAQYQQALEINPNHADARTNLGVALAQKGRLDEAMVQFQEVVRLNPGDTNAQSNLAKVQAMARQSAGAK